MHVKLDKISYRKFAKSILKTRSVFKAKSKNYQIHKSFFYLLKKLKPKNILIFTPLFYEPDLLILRRKLSKKYDLFLPLMVDKSLKMVKLKLPFKVSKFNIKEAFDSNVSLKHIDLAVVPVVGVDGNMARIGHGMGFYDRFFNTVSYRPIVVFVQSEDLFIKDKICDFHDLKCDFYLTPTKNYLKKGKYDRNFSRTRCRSSRHWCRISSS